MRDSMARKLWGGMVVALLGSLALPAAEPPRAAKSHVREFDIFVDGSKVGTSRLAVAEHPDGRTVATTDANIKITVLFYTYTHRYRGSESWQAGQPRKIEGRTNAGTDVLTVKAVTEASNTLLTVDEEPPRTGPAIHCTTSFWCWPASLDKVRSLHLLNVDKGETLIAACEKIGDEQILVGTRIINCTHYKLTGGTETELWFDTDRHLVQKKSLEEGHRAELRLQSITRIEAPPTMTAAKDVVPKQ